jgi:hypothetical protein
MSEENIKTLKIKRCWFHKWRLFVHTIVTYSYQNEEGVNKEGVLKYPIYQCKKCFCQKYPKKIADENISLFL